jgi:serine/threonine-protein kinase RsbW
LRAANALIRLSNRPEHVLVVRQALAGVAEALALDRALSNDLYTAVTEACNNAVMFAYGGAEGPMEVEVRMAAELLVVSVRDAGSGIPQDGAGSGIGLHLIQALANRVEIDSEPGRGTEVRMSFELQGSPDLHTPDGADPECALRDLQADTVRIELAPDVIVESVLPRAFAAVAAGARFSVDRLAAVERLGKALAGRALGEDCAWMTVRTSPRVLRVSLHPCAGAPGAAAELGASAPAGLVLEPEEDSGRSLQTLGLSVAQSPVL